MALRDMRGEGFDPSLITFALELEMVSPVSSRVIQSPQVLLQTEDDIKAICDTYAKRFGLDKDEDITVKLFRLISSAPVSHYRFPSYNYVGKNPERAHKSKRKVYWEDSFIETNIYEQKLLQCGNVVIGPAVVESENSVVLVPPRQKYTVDKFLNGILEQV
jgi:N-methylhydantoinase A